MLRKTRLFPVTPMWAGDITISRGLGMSISNRGISGLMYICGDSMYYEPKCCGIVCCRCCCRYRFQLSKINSVAVLTGEELPILNWHLDLNVPWLKIIASGFRILVLMPNACSCVCSAADRGSEQAKGRVRFYSNQL